jgi:hypothetical protein
LAHIESGAILTRVTVAKSEDNGWGESFGMKECETGNVSLGDPKGEYSMVIQFLARGLTHVLAHSAVTQTDGSIETFSEALTFSGLYGASTINPDNMSNNCVSVSIAKCLDFESVKELWRHTYGCDLPDQPLQVQEIEDLIRRTGWDFHWVMHVPKEGRDAYDVLVRQHHLDISRYGAISAAAYLRTDGSGHCVVLSARNVPAPLCYQHSNDGQYITEELKTAASIIVFYMRCPQNTTLYSDWHNRMLIRTMEERDNKRGWSLQKLTYQFYSQERELDKRYTFKRWCETFQSLGISDEDEDDVEGVAESAEHDSDPRIGANCQVEDVELHTLVRAKL